MEERRKLRKILFTEFLLMVAFAESALVSIWIPLPVWTTILFLVALTYIILHFIFGPLEWYLIYKLYLNYKISKLRRRMYQRIEELTKEKKAELEEFKKKKKEET